MPSCSASETHTNTTKIIQFRVLIGPNGVFYALITDEYCLMTLH